MKEPLNNEDKEFIKRVFEIAFNMPAFDLYIRSEQANRVFQKLGIEVSDGYDYREHV